MASYSVKPTEKGLQYPTTERDVVIVIAEGFEKCMYITLKPRVLISHVALQANNQINDKDFFITLRKIE